MVNVAKLRGEDLKGKTLREEGFGNYTNNPPLLRHSLLSGEKKKDTAVSSFKCIYSSSHLFLKLHPWRYFFYKFQFAYLVGFLKMK